MKKREILVVLGAGESGVGAAILGVKLGMDVLVSDNGSIPEKYKHILDQRGIPYEEGGHTAERILQADIAVKSPGIPPTGAMVEAVLLTPLMTSRVPISRDSVVFTW